MLFDQEQLAYAGFSRPIRAEIDIRNLEVIGEIPKEIRGTLFRTVPEWQFPPMDGVPPIPIDGDGMISAFRIQDGQVHYQTRWIENDRYLLQKKHGRALFGHFNNPLSNDPLAEGVSPTNSNTLPIFWNGKLLPNTETGLPTELDPVSLKTIRSNFDWDGQYEGPTNCSHPTYDPRTREFFTVGAMAKGVGTKDLYYFVVGDDGKKVVDQWIEAPFAALLHDFIVTEKYTMFPLLPVAYVQGEPKPDAEIYEWQPELGLYFGIMPRYGGEVRWIKVPARSSIHALGGWDEDGKIKMIAFDGEHPNYFWWIRPQDLKPDWNMKLSIWTIDLETGEFTTEALDDRRGEFPRIDERFMTQKFNIVFYCTDDDTAGYDFPEAQVGYMWNSLARYDLRTHEHTIWNAGPNSAVGECQFIPRSPDAPEGDGWLVAYVNRYDTRNTELVFFDATDITQPIARAIIPIQQHNAVHVSWAEGVTIP